MALKAKGLDFPATITPTTTLYPFLLSRKRTHFVVLRPRHTETPPQLVIGTFGNLLMI